MFFLLFVIVIITGNKLIQSNGNLYNAIEEEYRFSSFFEKIDSITTITLGNSHNLAIDFNSLAINGNGHHLWRPGQDIIESYIVLSEILNRKNSIKEVYYPIDFLFYNDNKNFYLNEFELVRSRFYYLTEVKHFKKYPWIPGDFFIWGFSKITYFNNITYTDSVQNCCTSDGQRHFSRLKKTIKDDFNFKNELYSKTGHFNLINASINKPRNKLYIMSFFYKLVEICGQNSISLTLYAPPHHGQYIELMNEVYPGLWESIVEDVAKLSKYPHVKFINLLHDPDFSKGNTYFLDDDHLNYSGAKAFSSLLRENKMLTESIREITN